MVYVSEEVMDKIKGRSPTRSLEMTDDERARVGQYFRIQIPIIDRGYLKDSANILRRIAATMDVCSSMWKQRDYELISIVKGEIALAHAKGRHAKSVAREVSDEIDATQNDADQKGQT